MPKLSITKIDQKITFLKWHWTHVSELELAFQRLNEYRKTSNISRTLLGTKIADHSDVVGASPVGAAPTTSSLST